MSRLVVTTRMRAKRPGTRWIALLILIAWASATVVLLREAPRSDLDSASRGLDLGDAGFYERVAARVEAGEDYYAAADRELHAGGYETSSTFNWRTPLYAYVLGKFHGPTDRQVALAGLSLATAVLAGRLVAVDLGRAQGMIAGASLVATSAWWVRPEPPWFTEAWAGQLILLAFVARSLRWPRTSLLAASLALFFRELALPFVALCLLDAWRRRHWSEAAAWSTCIAIYGLHFLWHESRVADHQFPERFSLPSDRANWVGWGGPAFVLATARMNYLLAQLPSWCAALYMPTAVLGLAVLAMARRRDRIVLFGFLGYPAAFLVLGRQFNFYWGWITAPTLALGFAVALGSLARAPGRPWRRWVDGRQLSA